MTITTTSSDPKLQANGLLLYLTRKCYYCEEQMKEVLSEMETFTGKAEILDLIKQYKEHIDHQIKCLKKVVRIKKIEESTAPCLTFETLWQEGKEMMMKSDTSAYLKDMQIIISMEQMVLFKVTNYSIIASFYRMFDDTEVAALLEHNLLEERERHAEISMISATRIFNSL